MQWVQDPSRSNVDNLHNGGREDGRHLRNKKKEYMKATIDELETNSKKVKVKAVCESYSTDALRHTVLLLEMSYFIHLQRRCTHQAA